MKISSKDTWTILEFEPLKLAAWDGVKMSYHVVCLGPYNVPLAEGLHK